MHPLLPPPTTSSFKSGLWGFQIEANLYVMSLWWGVTRHQPLLCCKPQFIKSSALATVHILRINKALCVIHAQYKMKEVFFSKSRIRNLKRLVCSGVVAFFNDLCGLPGIKQGRNNTVSNCRQWAWGTVNGGDRGGAVVARRYIYAEGCHVWCCRMTYLMERKENEDEGGRIETKTENWCSNTSQMFQKRLTN